MLPTSCFVLGILQNEARAIDEVYFVAPIIPDLENGRTGTITLSLTIETSSIVEITKDGVNWEEINNGVAITANREFIHKFAALTGDSINFRSKTAGNVRRAIVQVDSQEGPANSISSSGTSGPDTPWTVDHDAAGWKLLNLLVMESNAANPAAAGAIRLGNTELISWRNFGNTADIGLTVNISDQLQMLFNGISEYAFSTTQADWLGNNLLNVAIFETNAASPSTFGAIRLGNTEAITWRNAANTDNHSISFDALNQFQIDFNSTNNYLFTDAQADWKGNTLINVGFLESDAAIPATFGAVRLGNSESIEWRNNANTGDHFIFFSSSDQLLIGFSEVAKYGFTAAEADWAGQNLRNVGFYEDNSPQPANAGVIRLGINNSIRWRNLANTNNHNIRFTSAGDFIIDVDNVDEYAFGATTADFGSNSLINALFFESAAANPAASGAIRLGNAEQFNWRNAANSADIGLVANSSNLLALVGTLLLDGSMISNHSTLGTIDPTADFFLVLDATDGIVKKAIPNNFGLGGSVITRISGNSGAAGNDITYQHKTATQSHTSTTPDVDLTTTGVGAGTWHFRYVVIFQSAATTTGLRLAVNHTGTTGTFVMKGTFTSTGGTAATGIHDQILASATAGLVEAFAERVKNTTSKASVGVATANADQMVIIEGTIIVTVSGSLELKIGTEVAASAITTQIGTFMELTRIA